MQIKTLEQPVAAGSPTTYAYLLALVFPEEPEAQQEATAAAKTAPVRQIDGDYEPQPLTGDPHPESVSALPLMIQNRPLLLLNVPVTGKYQSESQPGQYDLLALFQTGPTPRLLDLVDIRSSGNQFSGFWTENPVINLTPATQACMIYQEHFNSSQSNMSIRLLEVRDQRLEELLGVSPFTSKGRCDNFSTKAVFWTEPDKDREYPRVAAELTVKMEASPADCQPRQRGFTRSYQGVWQWDPAKQKYRQVSGNLKKLYQFYDKYY